MLESKAQCLKYNPGHGTILSQPEWDSGIYWGSLFQCVRPGGDTWSERDKGNSGHTSVGCKLVRCNILITIIN